MRLTILALIAAFCGSCSWHHGGAGHASQIATPPNTSISIQGTSPPTANIAIEAIKGQDGLSVPLVMRLINNSSMEVAFYSSDPERDYLLIVQDGVGRDILLTPLGKLKRSPQIVYRRSLEFLAPGATYVETIPDILKLFDFPGPGIYSVRSTRRVINWSNDHPVGEPFDIGSNSVEIKIDAAHAGGRVGKDDIHQSR